MTVAIQSPALVLSTFSGVFTCLVIDAPDGHPSCGAQPIFPTFHSESTLTSVTPDPGSTVIFSLVNSCGCGLRVGDGACGSGPHPLSSDTSKPMLAPVIRRLLLMIDISASESSHRPISTPGI